MRFPAKVALLLCLTSAVPGRALAAPAATGSPRPEGLALHATRITSSIDVDGLLSESAWSQATPETTFFDSDPVEGALPSQRTEVRIAYDDDAIYVGAGMFDPAPDSILARLARRDVSIAADRFAVYLDPITTGAAATTSCVNAAGTLYDGTLSNDGWAGRLVGRACGTGASAMRRAGLDGRDAHPVLAAALREGERMSWGINFQRVIQRNNEEVYLVYQPKNGAGSCRASPSSWASRTSRPGRSIELLPYFTTKAELPAPRAGDPFNDGSRYTPATAAPTCAWRGQPAHAQRHRRIPTSARSRSTPRSST